MNFDRDRFPDDSLLFTFNACLAGTFVRAGGTIVFNLHAYYIYDIIYHLFFIHINCKMYVTFERVEIYSYRLAHVKRVKVHCVLSISGKIIDKNRLYLPPKSLLVANII